MTSDSAECSLASFAAMGLVLAKPVPVFLQARACTTIRNKWNMWPLLVAQRTMSTEHNNHHYHEHDLWMTALDLMLEGTEPEHRKLAILQAQRSKHALPDWQRYEAGSLTHLPRKYFLYRAKKADTQVALQSAWNDLLAPEPNDWSTLEQGLLYIAQWHDPDVNVRTIQEELDRMTEVVKTRLHEAKVSGVNISAESLDWISVMNGVFFQELGFEKHPDPSIHPNGALIQHILSRRAGAELTMCALYGLLASRVGFHTTLTCTPFLLRIGSVFVDVTNGGTLTKLDELLLLYQREPTEMNSRQSLIRVINLLVSSLFHVGGYQEQALDHLEQLLLIDPLHEMRLTHLSLLIQLMMNPHELNYDYYAQKAEIDKKILSDPSCYRLFKHFNEIILRYNQAMKYRKTSTFEKSRVRLRRYNDDIKFVVGTVVHNTRDNYRGVIVGWHRQHPSTQNRYMKTKSQDAANKLDQIATQAFYEVLCDDDSLRLSAAVHTKAEADPLPVNCVLAGRYFRMFSHGRYLPNAWIRLLYPQL